MFGFCLLHISCSFPGQLLTFSDNTGRVVDLLTSTLLPSFIADTPLAQPMIGGHLTAARRPTATCLPGQPREMAIKMFLEVLITLVAAEVTWAVWCVVLNFVFAF